MKLIGDIASQWVPEAVSLLLEVWFWLDYFDTGF